MDDAVTAIFDLGDRLAIGGMRTQNIGDAALEVFPPVVTFCGLNLGGVLDVQKRHVKVLPHRAGNINGFARGVKKMLFIQHLVFVACLYGF